MDGVRQLQGVATLAQPLDVRRVGLGVPGRAVEADAAVLAVALHGQRLAGALAFLDLGDAARGLGGDGLLGRVGRQ